MNFSDPQTMSGDRKGEESPAFRASKELPPQRDMSARSGPVSGMPPQRNPGPSGSMQAPGASEVWGGSGWPEPKPVIPSATPAASSAGVASWPDSAASPMEDRLSEILSVNCPACGHGMNLQRKHLGIRGKCVNCGEALVAIERPGAGVIAVNPDAPETMPRSPEPERAVSAIEAGREPAGGAAHHSTRDPGVEAGFATLSAGSSKESAVPGRSRPGTGESGDTESGDRRTVDRDAAPGSAAGRGRSRLEEGFASLFRKQADEDETNGSPVAPSPLPTVPDRNLGGDHPSLFSDGAAAVPWAEQTRKEDPFDQPKKPAPPDGVKDPFADRLENPISRSVKAAVGGFSAGIGPEIGGSAAGSWPGSVRIEESDPDGAAESGRQQTGGGFPGVSVEQLKNGRRNIFVRFFVGLMKLTAMLAAIAGVGVGVYFLTPPEKMKEWKEAAIEWLRPGLVLRDHLPFKVPFLEKLAREEMLENGAPRTVTQAQAGAPDSPEPVAAPDPEVAEPPAAPKPETAAKARDPLPPEYPPAATPERSEDPAEDAGESMAERPADRVPESTDPPHPVEAGAGESDASRPAPDLVGPPAPAHAAAGASAEPETTETDPSEMLEPMGRVVLASFYGAQTMDDRRQYLLDPAKYGAAMEAFYGRYRTLPIIRETVFRGPMRDASSGLWFGVFDVYEEQNEDVHRWCVVQIEPGNPKIDWGLYQQLIDRSLERFLSDPASPPKAFRALINRGEPVAGAENPWGVPAVELFLRTPLDTAKARRIVAPQSECGRLGLTEHLIANHARIAELELSWLPGASDPSQRFPSVTGVFSWGAW